MTLRRRLLLGVLAVVVVLVTSNLVLAATFEGYLMGRVDEQLADTLDRPVLSRRAQLGATGETLTDLFIGIADVEAGTLVRVGSGLSDADPPALGATELLHRATILGESLEPFTAASLDGEVRWRIAAVGLGREVLVVGIDLADLDAALTRARRIQVATSVAVVVALGAVSWWVLRLGVRPLLDMATAADDIAAGDLGRRVGEVDDRTEAGRLARAMNTMVSELESSLEHRVESEARVRQFAADASHELRTPLTSIRGYAELWQAGALRAPEEAEDAMRRIGQEATRMQALVDDLMLLARLDQDRALAERPVALDQLAVDSVRDARAVDPQRPITVDAQEAWVMGDEDALRQVVANLVTNALVHTESDAAVVVATSSDGRHALLSVADEGPGMEPEVAARIFERFVRADPARARSGSGGSGLGLAIVRSVAEAHGGIARVETAPGRGSRFVVELPAAPSDLVGGSQDPPR